MHTDDQEFAARLAAAREGDEYAWHGLFRLVSGRVVGYLISRGAPDPEGVAGDVFFEIVRSIDRFEGDERGFRSWVLTIAHRRMIDARRRHGRRDETPLPLDRLDRADGEDVEGAILHLAGAAEARRLLEHLTPAQADVVALRIYGELTLPEVAEHLGKPLTAVTSLQKRGMDRLRRLLESPDEA